MDRNLRDLLELAVGEPPRLMSVEAVRRRATRRRLAQLGAVGSAIALVAGLGISVAVAVSPGSPPATNKSGKTSGPPRYYAEQYYDTRAHQEALVIRARTTGRITAAIGDPRPGAHCGGGNVGFAAADDRTFYLICVIWRENPVARKITVLESFVYRLHVTAAGRIGDFSLVSGGALKGVWAYNIAAAPNGSQVAVEVIRPGPSGKIYTNSVAEGIFVINTRTGVRALWRTGPYRPGTVQFASGTDVSFTRDGSELVVMESRCERTRYVSTFLCYNGLQLRAYAQAARGGSLEGGKVLLPKHALKLVDTSRGNGPTGASLTDAFIAPNGTAATGAVINCPRHGPCTLSVTRISVSTGHTQRVLYHVRSGTAFQGVSFGFISVDPSGRYVILDGAHANGWIDRGRLRPLAPASNYPEYEAW